MKNTQLRNQLVRMFVSGLIGTAVAIMSERRFDHWWAGLIGIPIALFASGIRESWQALRFAGKSVRKIKLKESMRGLIPDTAITMAEDFGNWATSFFRKALALTAVFGSLILVIMIVMIPLVLLVKEYAYAALIASLSMCFGLWSYKTVQLINGKQDARPHFFLVWSLCKVVVKNGFGESPEGRSDFDDTVDGLIDNGGRLRDCNGKLFSFSRCKMLGKESGSVFLAFGFMFLLSLSLVPLLLVDFVLAGIWGAAITRSVSVALGVVIGFSVDYFCCPRGATSLTGFEWLTACSLLGALSGIGIWVAKIKIHEWAERVVIARAEQTIQAA